MFYPNQRYITINRENVSSSKKTGRLYMIMYQDNVKFAMRDLSASAFKCYLTLAMQKDRFIMDYSPEYISSVASIHPNTCRKAMKELQEKGYLIQIDEKNYNFYEYPHYTHRKPTIPDKEESEVREIIDKRTGEVFHYTYDQVRQCVDEETANRLWTEAKIIW